ncbi:MAG TPA: hypothetical protein VGG28_18575 [Kofleriaceae bacterium]
MAADDNRRDAERGKHDIAPQVSDSWSDSTRDMNRVARDDANARVVMDRANAGGRPARADAGSTVRPEIELLLARSHTDR